MLNDIYQWVTANPAISGLIGVSLATLSPEAWKIAQKIPGLKAYLPGGSTVATDDTTKLVAQRVKDARAACPNAPAESLLDWMESGKDIEGLKSAYIAVLVGGKDGAK